MVKGALPWRPRPSISRPGSRSWVVAKGGRLFGAWHMSWLKDAFAARQFVDNPQTALFFICARKRHSLPVIAVHEGAITATEAGTHNCWRTLYHGNAVRAVPVASWNVLQPWHIAVRVVAAWGSSGGSVRLISSAARTADCAMVLASTGVVAPVVTAVTQQHQVCIASFSAHLLWATTRSEQKAAKDTERSVGAPDNACHQAASALSASPACSCLLSGNRLWVPP